MSSELEKRFFWQQFLAVVNKKTNLYQDSNIRKNKHYIHIKTGTGGQFYSTVCKLDESWVELCIQRKDDSEKVFNDLRRFTGAIEREYGESLNWVNDPELQRCKIMAKPVPLGRNENNANRLSEILVDKMEKFYNAVQPFLSQDNTPKRPRNEIATKSSIKITKRRPAPIALKENKGKTSIKKIDGTNIPAIESLFKKAMNCKKCFDEGVAIQANIDLPQPRLIGSQYFHSSPRIMVIALNPGAGNTPTKVVSNRIFKQYLYDYKNQIKTIDELFSYQAAYMTQWGTPPGKYLKFYCDGMGLSLEKIAMANIAWCADTNNKYPPAMLNGCFSKHTGELVKLLEPNVIVLSGSSTHKFSRDIDQLLPDCSVINTLHYAHREGKSVEQEKLRIVREQIS